MNLVELVPRDLEETLQTARTIVREFPGIDGFNVPDILRLPHRSYDVAELFLKEGFLVVPHIRTIDFQIPDLISLIYRLVEQGLKKVLLITGDIPANISKPIYPTKPLEAIREVRKAFPDLEVYGAIDPYRQSVQKELDYAHTKLAMGATGFFTQPFFDVRWAEIYLEQLQNCPVFLGISPVQTQSSQNYWTTRNNVVFPTDFSLENDYTISVSRALMTAANKGHHTYLMPIKVDPVSFLRELLR